MPRLWLAAVVCLAASAMTATTAQQPTFKGGVEAVRVDVLVTRGGQPVEGLTAADFQVRDSGVLQTVDRVAFEDIRLNVVLALDGSQSVKGEREEHLYNAGLGLIDRLKPGEQAALVRFGDDVMVGSPLTDQLNAVREALAEPPPLGSTALIDAAYTAVLLGEAASGRSLVVIFSDGVETASYLDAASVIAAIRRADAVVYAVTAVSGGKSSFLRDATEASGGELLEMPAIADLGKTLLKVLDQFRHRYLVSYTPRGVSGQGWHRLQVQVKTPGAKVTARQGYERR